MGIRRGSSPFIAVPEGAIMTSGRLISAATVATLATILVAAPAALAANAAAAATEELQEVLVTARGRVEQLQEVPLAITSLGSETIENAGVENIREIAYLTPGITIRSFGAEQGVRAVIRGQADIQGGTGDPGVAIFLDGVYLANSGAVSLGVMNLERVEVVKGPVSALYGRNAANGAINYISRSPGDKLVYRATATFGADALAGGRFYIAGPVIQDRLSLGFAFQSENYDGGYQDKLTGIKAGGYRKNDMQVTAAFKPVEKLSIKAAYYYGDDKFGLNPGFFFDNTCGVPAPAGLSAAEMGVYPALSAYCGEMNPGRFQSPVPPAEVTGNTRRVDLASLHVDYDFGPLTASLIAGYNKEKSLRFGNLMGGRYAFTVPLLEPGAPANCIYLTNPLCDQTINVTYTGFGGNIVTKERSLELRLTSASEQRFRWQAGGFYYKEDNEQYNSNGTRADLPTACLAAAGVTAGCRVGSAAPNATLNDLLVNNSLLQTLNLISPAGTLVDILSGTFRTAKQSSWFAGFDVDLVKGLSLAGEFRDVKDTRTLQGKNPPSFNGGGLIGTQRLADFTYNNYRVTLKYDIQPGMMVYASNATGTRAGGFNTTTYVPELTFDPEKNTASELGFKSAFLDGKLKFNTAVFHVNADNLQIAAPTGNPAPNGSTDALITTKNVGIVSTDGFEVEVSFSPTRNATLNFGLGYADPKISGKVYQVSSARSPLSPATSPANADPNTACLLIPSCAPRVDSVDVDPSAAVALRYRANLGGLLPPAVAKLQYNLGAELTGHAFGEWNWRARGDYRYESKQYLDLLNLAWWGPRMLTNLRFGLEKNRVRIEAFVDNLSQDNTPEVGSYGFENRTGGVTFLAASAPAARTFGLQASYRFD
jgi:outer membrane receptor protein involved in Fe transport